eukprot:TRINITY_DN47789_c0_g1_i1.p1 TRINITY_DN47789_c0_g1~~TRINITY_DN47789_c0_g1_i1.p1  ORF type:complete len:514 (+),score=117.98 TRINITY_DN47789_c0_g1_i1:130-1542(+)
MSRPRTGSASPPRGASSSGAPPPPEQIVDYARYIGIDPLRTDLMWIAEQGLTAPLPEGWSACRLQEEDRTDPSCPEVYYYNDITGETMWDHPLDEQFREISRAFAAMPPDDAAAVVRRGVAHTGLVSQVASMERSKAVASTQTAVERADGSAQAVSGHCTAETQASVTRRSRGHDPMPTDAVTMTAPVTRGRETMTTPSLMALQPGGQWSPRTGSAMPRLGLESARACGEQSAHSLRSLRASRQLPSPSAAAAQAHSPWSSVAAVAAAADEALQSTARHGTTRLDQSLLPPPAGRAHPSFSAPPPSPPAAPVAAPPDVGTTHTRVLPLAPQHALHEHAPGAGGEEGVQVAMITPAAEALMREMVASFQHQLLEHRREVYEAITREWEQHAALRNTLCGDAAGQPPVRLPRATPPPQRSTAELWGTPQWALFYAMLLVAHMTCCVVVCFALPLLLSAELWDAILDDPRSVL